MANYSKLYVFTFLVFTFVTSIFGNQEFIEEPYNITIERGRSVTFPCQVKIPRDTVQWTKDEFGLGTDRNLRSYPRYQMLGAEGSGNYSLHISTVLLSDEGEYQCQVREDRLVSKVAKLTVLYPPKDDEGQVSMLPNTLMKSISGSEVRITCRVGDTKPVSNITWYKNDDKITAGIESSIENLPKSQLQTIVSWVKISVSKDYHDANISCHVSHPALDQPIIRSVIMSVQYPPSVDVYEEFIDPKEGDTLKFSCTAFGNPKKFQYRWEMNDEPIGGDEPKLILDKVTRKDNTAVIKCIASNIIGSGEGSKTLDISYEPLFEKEPKDVSEEDDKDATLECLVDSNPQAEVVWTNEYSNKVIAHGSTYTLKVNRETAGMYRCRVTTPGYGEISRSIMVFRRGPPRILPNQIMYGLSDNRVEIQCLMESIPRPTEVAWYKNNLPISKENSMKFEFPENLDTRSGTRARLLINNAQVSDFGMYNCTATNEYGTDSKFVEIRRQNTLPLVTTLVSVVGIIVFVVVVVIVILLFRRRGKTYDEPNMDKGSVQSTEPSLTDDSVLKLDSRTGSDFSHSDDTLDDWETNSSSISPKHYNRRPKDTYRFSGDFSEPLFPLKNIPSAGSDYNSYVGYNGEYQPPPQAVSPNFARNSIYASHPLNNMDLRYSAAYGNPYLKIPPNSRAVNYANVENVDSSAAPQNNNLNNRNLTNKNVIYNPIGHNRNNLRNNQYIVLPQSDQQSIQGTQI